MNSHELPSTLPAVFRWTWQGRLLVFTLSAMSIWCLLAEFYGLCSMLTFNFAWKEALSNRAGGPVAVKAGAPGGALIPATQQYLVYVDILDPDPSIVPGTMAQVKIHCQPETCLRWLWRTLNSTFDLGLM